MKTITVHDGQSIYDLANQLYGAIEGVFWLMADNNLQLDSFIKSGQVLRVREEKLSVTADYFLSRTINNTDDGRKEGGELLLSLVRVGNATDGKGGFALVSVEGGYLDYAFYWTDETGQLVTRSQNLTGAGPGSYTLVVIDARGQSAELKVDILNRITKSYLVFRPSSGQRSGYIVTRELDKIEIRE
jgi:hypothetical protein